MTAPSQVTEIASKQPGPSYVGGVDVDAAAAAVRTCADVDDLDGGPLEGVATYLPGRRVRGIVVSTGVVTVHVRSVWNAPAVQVAAQIRRALEAIVAGRRVDVVISDIALPF